VLWSFPDGREIRRFGGAWKPVATLGWGQTPTVIGWADAEANPNAAPRLDALPRVFDLSDLDWSTQTVSANQRPRVIQGKRKAMPRGGFLEITRDNRTLHSFFGFNSSIFSFLGDNRMVAAQGFGISLY